MPLKLAADVMDYKNGVIKTIMMTVPSVILQLISVLLAGYGFARFKFKGRKILFGLLVFTIIVPVQSYAIPLYVNFTRFDYFGLGTVVGWITGKALTTNLINTNSVFYLRQRRRHTQRTLHFEVAFFAAFIWKQNDDTAI